MEKVSFGKAIEALTDGKRVKRDFWHSQHFIFMQVPATIDKSIVPNMQSLPQPVKDEFERRFEQRTMPIDAIRYRSQFAYVSSNCIITSYSPSVGDSLAEDWIVLD